MSNGSPNSHHPPLGFAVSLANEQAVHAVDEEQLRAAACRVLQDSPFRSAVISLAVVDEPTIHELNRRYLGHDWPTDVLSFALDQHDGHLEGEVVISADAAAEVAAEGGWLAAEEQMLYVIHGTLHLVGFDDQAADDAARMRAAERDYLHKLGVEMPRAQHPTPNTQHLTPNTQHLTPNP